MNSTRLVWVFWAGIVATLAFASYSLTFRFRVESRNRAVELLMEWDALESLAGSQKLSVDEALNKLKSSGVGALVLSEQTVGELIDGGSLRLVSKSDPPELTLTASPSVLRRVERGLDTRFGDAFGPDGLSGGSLGMRGISPATLRTLDVGLDDAACQMAKAHGLRIYARGSNPMGATAETVRKTIGWFRDSGAAVFLPQGDQVLGRRDNLKVLGEALAAHEMLYASPEFAKLGGDINVVQGVPERVVRLHSAQAAELDKLPFGEAVERYVRAGRERNIRALLLRPLAFSAEKPLDEFVRFVGAVKKGIEREGGAAGPAKPFEDAAVPRWVFPIIGLGAAAVASFAASNFSRRPIFLGFVVLIGLVFGLGAWLPEIRGYTALWAALAFPVAAFGLLVTEPKVGWTHYGVLTAVCLIGGLAVAGLLNGLPFFIRADQFEGVKAAHFLPIFLGGYLMAANWLDWRAALKNPITWLQAFIAIFILVALAFMFARTGNDNPAAVSGVELKLRSVLDNVLPVRPRTKEFLFGYPSLVIGLGLLMRVRSQSPGGDALRGWAILALMVGGIAITSVVNTMCHLHTPLEAGLLRIAVGFILGGIIGAGAWAVLKNGLPDPRT